MDPDSNPVSDPDLNPDPKRFFRFRIGSGSGQKFRILPDPVPDPQHWLKVFVADPDPGSGAFLALDPGFGAFLTLDTGSGGFLTLDPGSGMELFRSRIRDKHPGSAD